MPNHDPPPPRDEQDRWLLDTVGRVGWAVIGVPDDEEGPGFSYSIGLTRTLGHPEVFMMGLRPEVAQQLINLVGEAVRFGERFGPGRRYDGIAEGFPLAFVPVAGRYYDEYLGWALWFYQGADFPVLQCVWPDKAGVFPWEPGYDSRFFDRQRVLGGG